MESLVLLLLLLAGVCSCSERSSNFLRQCRSSTNLSLTSLGVLPGGGWDNLRNVDMGRVMNLSYLQCQSTEDGLYLLPDEVFVIPQKETALETSSELISSWLQLKSSTSGSINADVSFLTRVNGKFSTENQRMKTHQVKESSTTTRVQVRNVMYTVKAYPDFTLDSRFVQQLKDIGDAIENNQTKNAAYLSERMVLDYGTHVVTSVDAGATLVEEDYVNAKYISDNVSRSSNIRAQAGFNFFDKLKFDIGGGSSSQSASLQEYQSNIQYSLVQSHGGVPFYPGITLQKWQESTRNNLVAVDRSGVPLHHVLNRNTLPELPPPTVEKVALSLKKAVQRYYEVNTRPGCVDVGSRNFNFQANVDDASCEGPGTNLSFGGVFQRCEAIGADAAPLCERLAQRNPDTGDFSCRSPYGPTLLRSEVRQEGYTRYECYDQSYKCGLFRLSTCHRQVCQDVYYVRSARVDTFWCSVKGAAPENSGFLFGGFFGPSALNPVTNTKGCPPNFLSLQFLSDGLTLCQSRDYESGSRFAVRFGGLFSCQSNNPLAGERRRCPAGFSQHLAAVSDGCEVLYCVQSGLFTGGELEPVRLPPFTRAPLVSRGSADTVMVMTEGQKTWVRLGTTKLWKEAQAEEAQDMVRQMNPQYDELTGGEKAGAALGAVALVALVVAVTVAIVKKRRRGGATRFSMNRSYEELQGDSETTRLTPQTA